MMKVVCLDGCGELFREAHAGVFANNSDEVDRAMWAHFDATGHDMLIDGIPASAPSAAQDLLEVIG